LYGKHYPVIKNYYAGGMGTVRGYESGTIGGVDSNDMSVGGNRRVFGNLEMIFPFALEGKDRTLRWFTFFDAGTVWKEEENMSFSELRYSAGLGISWESPIGPLKLSYGVPLNAKTDDRKQSFQFQIGTGF
jgi:outer membrane protein insertion porin family